MRRVLVLMGLLLAGCTATRPGMPPPEAPAIDVEPVAEETSMDGVDHAADASGVLEGDAGPGVDAVDDDVPAAPPPSTTTVPTVEVDLSGLDEMLHELDAALDALGSAMAQSEGEFTP